MRLSINKKGPEGFSPRPFLSFGESCAEFLQQLQDPQDLSPCKLEEM